MKTAAHTRYRLADGTPVPGVTTVVGLLAKPALVRWANRLGLEGVDVTKYVDRAAQAGSFAHELILEHFGGPPADRSAYPADVVDAGENAFISFLEWSRTSGVSFEPVACEHQMVSERHRFGGTVDLIARSNGSLVLVDFKTSAALYDEHVVQVAAYRELARENGFDVERVMLLRVGRDESEGFDVRYVGERSLAAAWRVFAALLEIYNAKKEVRL